MGSGHISNCICNPYGTDQVYCNYATWCEFDELGIVKIKTIEDVLRKEYDKSGYFCHNEYYCGNDNILLCACDTACPPITLLPPPPSNTEGLGINSYEEKNENIYNQKLRKDYYFKIGALLAEQGFFDFDDLSYNQNYEIIQRNPVMPNWHEGSIGQLKNINPSKANHYFIARPNPFENIFEVDYKYIPNRSLIFTLVDNLGNEKVKVEESTTSPYGSVSISNVNSLPPGIYYLLIRDTTLGIISSQKVFSR